DIKGFTERTSRQTLEQNQTLLRTHHDLLAPVFRAFHGKIIKEIGDAFLVTFESPTQAVLAGVALQDKLWVHNRTLAADDRIEVRVAINCGEVRLENNDVFGEPVNIASRVEGLADAGDVFLTESVYLAMNKAEVPSEEVGLFELKGIPGKIRVFKVPHAPYRVAPVVSGTAAPSTGEDAPPYGNLGLSKMPDGTGAELTARAVELTSKAMHGGEELMKRAVQEMSTLDGARSMKLVRPAAKIGMLVVALLLAGSAVRWLTTSSLERAVVAVEQAGPEEKKAKIEAVLKLLGEEKNRPKQQYWSGRLQEARDDPGALRHYKSAVQQGSSAAEDRLISLIDHRRCEWRVGALEAVGELKLVRARPRVVALAENGGADDVQKVLFLGCNSKHEAAAVLRQLE
ncbi:MAG: Adenylate cyclase, partial [Myxococcaceae bacterium]|nr:Adenylate cyclase [Myxococcaceae bacterium]